MVRWIHRIIEGDRHTIDIPQFNELFGGIGSYGRISIGVQISRPSWVEMDFIDNDWTHFRIWVGLSRALPKFHHGIGIIHAKGTLAHGHKLVIIRQAGVVMPEGDAIGGRFEFFVSDVSRQFAGCVGLREHDLVALRGIERKRLHGIRAEAVEPLREVESFVEHAEAAVVQGWPSRNQIFFPVVPLVAQPPPTDVHRRVTEVLKLNGIFQRKIRVREQFVHVEIREKEEIGVAGGTGFEIVDPGEKHDGGTTVWQTPLRNVGCLNSIVSGVVNRRRTNSCGGYIRVPKHHPFVVLKVEAHIIRRISRRAAADGVHL